MIDTLGLLWWIVMVLIGFYAGSETQTISQIREIYKEIDKIYEVLAK